MRMAGRLDKSETVRRTQRTRKFYRIEIKCGSIVADDKTLNRNT